MKYEELKPLLRQGDCKEVAELCNVSTTFVQNVWREKTRGTVNANAVLLATVMKIEEREEYRKKIVAAVMRQKEERKKNDEVVKKENAL